MTTTITRYINSDTTVSVAHFNEGMIVEQLPVHTYRVKFEKFSGFFLEKVFNEFKIPTKIYGDARERANRICSRYLKDNKSLGTLLLGDKGSGKTLLATILVDKFINDYKKPVIIIDNNFGDLNSEMISFISQFNNCLFLFDEFEKLFKIKDQELFLNFFDDKFNNNRLSLLIANDRYVSEFLLDRPSRFFYKYEYEKLDDQTIKEVLEDYNLSDLYEDFITMKAKTGSFSFDILSSIIDEILLTGCKDLETITKGMNVTFNKYSFDNSFTYTLISCRYIRGDKLKSFSVKVLNAFEVLLTYETYSNYTVAEKCRLELKEIVKVKEDETTHMLPVYFHETEEESYDHHDSEYLCAYYEIVIKKTPDNLPNSF